MSTTTSERLKRIVGVIDKWIDYQSYMREIPGVAIGISVGEETIFSKGYGYANVDARHPVTPATRFRIASHSKVFTATALMQLVSDGSLRLDDPVSHHLSWFRAEGDENLSHVTIRQLLTHSSGLIRDGDTGHWSSDRFPELPEIMRQVAGGPSVYSSNEHLKYSNFAYTVAGQIIEAVTGTPYEEHVTGAILDPLGLSATTPDLPDDMSEHATGYSKRFPDRPRIALNHVAARVMNAATGFSSNVDDLLRWYQAHLLGNDRLLNDWDKREMQRLQYEDRTYRWGIGFEHTKVADLGFVGHGGGYPGFITFSSLNQEHQLAIAVLTNAIDGPAGIFFEGIAKLLAKALEDDFEGDLDASIDRFTGFYADRWHVELVDRVGGALVSMNADSADPNLTLETNEHVEGARFRAPITLAISSPGEEFWFEEVNEAPRLAYPGGFMERFDF
ncbi:MAG: beta-lactamase family protein [Acidimicrobiia bacterium]|nr:beta-lactamase family protein [Acidimicrobiia bacterium]